MSIEQSCWRVYSRRVPGRALTLFACFARRLSGGELAAADGRLSREL